MTQIHITLDKENINPEISSLKLETLLYGRNGQLVLVNLRDNIDLVRYDDKEKSLIVKLPSDTMVKTIGNSEIDLVLDKNKEIIWDHPKLKDCPEFLLDGTMKIAASVNGERFKITGEPVGQYELQSYMLSSVRAGITPSPVDVVSDQLSKMGN